MKQLHLFILAASLLPTLAIIWSRVDAAAQQAAHHAALERLVSGYGSPLQRIIADGVTQSHDELEQRERDQAQREREALRQIEGREIVR